VDKYLQQFAGDLLTVPCYFVYSDNSPDFGSLDRNECERVFNHMSSKFPSITFEIRILEVSEDWSSE